MNWIVIAVVAIAAYGYLKSQSGGTTAPTSPGAAAAGTSSSSTGLAAGTVVRTPSNQFGVVNQDGTIAPQTDVNWPQIYTAIQRNYGIVTLTDAQWSAAGGNVTPASTWGWPNIGSPQ